MKIRQTIFLLPLFLLAGCASAGGSQSRDLDLKELCTEEQVFQYADFEWGTDSEQLFKQSSLKFDEKDLGQGDESSTKTYEEKRNDMHIILNHSKKNFPWKMQNLTWIWNFRTVS